MEIRAAIQAEEIEVHDDGDISGIAVNLAVREDQKATDVGGYRRSPRSDPLRRLGYLQRCAHAFEMANRVAYQYTLDELLGGQGWCSSEYGG